MMKISGKSKSLLSTLGLLMITVWSAMQYLFYSNVPEDISTFAFLVLTNLCGCVVLGLAQFRHLKKITAKTVKKAVGLSVIQLCLNFFVLLGSRGMDSVIISSVMSLYFIFVTPLLLLLRKKVSFRSCVATVVALIALLLVFNANIEGIFQSANVIFLFIANLFFAGYIVFVSLTAQDEDPQALAVVQMASCAVLSMIAWVIEAKLFGHGSLSLNVQPAFWISVLFIGIFIRALYSVIQFAAQKNVPPVSASLIFASEVVITLILNPLLCKLFGTSYEPATVFQIAGCILFVVAVLICDDEFMKKFQYNDMDTVTVRDENGKEIQQVPLSRKIVNMNLLIGLGTLVFSTLICLVSIYTIRSTVIDTSKAFGNNASSSSETALLEQVKSELVHKVSDKAAVATERLKSYETTAQYVADTASEMLCSPEAFEKTPVDFPWMKNKGIWAMQMVLADESVSYEKVQAQNEALGNLETLFASIQSRNEQLTTIYIGTADGLLISYDPNSDGAGVNGTPFYYDYRESDWYKGAKMFGKPGYTETYIDQTGRGLTITCFAPVYDANGVFIGALGMDLLQQDISEKLVSDGIVAPEIAVLVSAEGTVIAATGDSAEEKIETIKDSSFKLPLSGVADIILTGTDGLLVTEESENGYYVAYDTISLTGWKLCIVSPVKEIIAPAASIRENIDENTEKISNTVGDGIRVIICCCLIFFAVIVLLIVYAVGKVAAKITDPLKHLEQDVKEISQGNFDQRTAVDTEDEIGSLARAFNQMTSSLQQYITDLTEETAKRERLNSELSVATDVQLGILPSETPSFPNHNEFELCTTMHPAKEVGGDFYDYFLIDESHLGLVIADVSGKGVPAALFMVIAKTMIKNRALLGGTPSEILSFVNNQLCENNSAEMFVTVWLGILDLKTGKLTATNAGHEFPAIRRKNGEFELYKDRHGFVVAGMENSRYTDYELQLGEGDTLFVYTDGVAEANNEKSELFGTEKMLTALNSAKDGDCRAVLSAVSDGIRGFVGEAPQFDDITMLCIRLDRYMQ